MISTIDKTSNWPDIEYRAQRNHGHPVDRRHLHIGHLIGDVTALLTVAAELAELSAQTQRRISHQSRDQRCDIALRSTTPGPLLAHHIKQFPGSKQLAGPEQSSGSGYTQQ